MKRTSPDDPAPPDHVVEMGSDMLRSSRACPDTQVHHRGTERPQPPPRAKRWALGATGWNSDN
eukprot:6716015-Pyramimonas_sp.AAC.1